MKIVSKQIERNGSGSVKMVAIDSDDLWHAYNLIGPGDTLKALTVRKVVRETASGAKEAERKKLELEIKVVEVADYDKVGCILRVRGKNILQNDYVQIGAYHTLELELNRPFVLQKKVWDSYALDVLHQASVRTLVHQTSNYFLEFLDSDQLARILLLMQEGLAHVLLVGKSVTITRVRIEASIPRKYGPVIGGYESVLKKFFENLMQAFLNCVDFNVVRCVVIASPGFTKDQFYKHLLLEAERRQLRPIIENKSRIMLIHTNSGYKHSLREVLDDPNVMSMIKDTKAAQEVRALKNFFSMLTNDPDRACYGPKHVEVAHERLAIKTLLITDDLFRNNDVKQRKKYVNFVDSVRDSGGIVHIFSSMHVSGEELAQITGIAAILRYPMPDLDDIEMFS